MNPSGYGGTRHKLCTDISVKSVFKVSVCWCDGYTENFECTEICSENNILWMHLVDETNRYIPLCSIRWFSMTPENYNSKIGCYDNCR